MPHDNITHSTHRSALARIAALRDHPLNSRDKTVWWDVAHRMLAQHAPNGTSPAACARCEKVWPCDLAQGVIDDLEQGHLGY
ncbi:hypothetical protein [Prauserella endophytica]|uniref:4Fe-4S Wbl-type domain-containing protein n=1 Tax=Prauserella endophytica TaxID=1592324 RepID=A0ABY2RUW6_9PSEU|nr:hypothetical protein [Prauserella endophytica]TKG61509.1 hypothetical protein FCN18_33250 [Prauserella endophytica]